ncbi:hypothetical protein ACLKA7_003264 [Drosophila subpalustris]
MHRSRVAAVSTPSYSNLVGFIFIFNLIVGTGALTLPGVFARAGWALSLVVLLLLAIISYMTVTFVIEAMACANAIKNWQNLQVLRRRGRNSHSENENENEREDGELETVPLINTNTQLQYYQLTHKFELAVSRSLRDVICEHDHSNSSDISILESKSLYGSEDKIFANTNCCLSLAGIYVYDLYFDKVANNRWI